MTGPTELFKERLRKETALLRLQRIVRRKAASKALPALDQTIECGEIALSLMRL